MTSPVVGGERPVLFVSYAGPDRPWAEWAATQLKAAGYVVELDVWDWAAGESFVLRMDQALTRAERVVALWSPSYFETERYTRPEWMSAFVDAVHDPGRRRMIPVRVAKVDPPKVLADVIYRDVFGMDEAAARRELLTAVEGASAQGRAAAPFPGGGPVAVAGPRRPGSLPPVWNVPARLVGFTGRRSLLADLRHRLSAGQTTLVAAVNGLGGVGKTSLAIEYAHLFAGEYERVWWVDAERPELIGENLSRLAVASGWAGSDAPVGVMVEAVAARLRQTDRWLVIFDNVEEPDHVRAWLPQGAGHVIITSRHRRFTGLAHPLEVQVFTRAESVDLIRSHLPHLGPGQADALAEVVGDLPLALAQAIGLLAETAMTVPEYLAELSERARAVLSEGRGGDRPVPLAAAIETTLTRLRPQDVAAVELLHLVAVLAPEPLPLDWLRAAGPQVLPDRLGAVVVQPLALRRTLGRLADLGLAQLGEHTVQVHRLTQAVLRDIRTPDQLQADRADAVGVVTAAEPDDDGTDPGSWPAWAALLPHLLALEPATAPAPLRSTACNALWYLLSRGEHHTAVPLAETWHTHWQTCLGPEDLHVLSAANQRATAYRLSGRHQEAYDLDQATSEARRRVQGPDHPDTLTSFSNLAIDLRELGCHQEAYELHRDTLEVQRRVLGPDHLHTLTSANHFAIDLRELGRHQEAYELHQVTLEAMRRVLGPDHPNTLGSAGNLAHDLMNLGRHQEAYDLNQATLETRRRVQGPDHPDTLTSASNLAVDLTNLGRHREAYELDRITLEARRRVLGPDHPDTLTSASNLAVDLSNLDLPGEFEGPTDE